MRLITLAILMILLACKGDQKSTSEASLKPDDLPNLMFSEKSDAGAPATLESISWLAGHWQGEALGGKTEEIWSPAEGGSMMGMFRLLVGEKVQFYELMSITEEDSSLVLRIKHFNHDLTGWEEKDEREEFHLVRVTPQKLFFDGITFEKVAPDRLHIYVLFGDKERGFEEEKFEYRMKE
jgi:hypothetical protein